MLNKLECIQLLKQDVIPALGCTEPVCVALCLAHASKVLDEEILSIDCEVNIGIFNLLPIPGLDGYQAILSLIEGIIHREVPVKVKYALQVLGLALVFGLMIAVTYQDILRLFK